ncbi:hypothetical protein EDD18DRAFT_1111219 [Armillaria luteobubalina]|uniref:Uncharacterized protein n=1 Tax=Armillaria luteobubalina TaxID=153913 RepID=A0AA39UGR6_9AGAR|nr:hypothetical protein EDD18DRAFT_1111219 [Armillaria luteobubalina]
MQEGCCASYYFFPYKKASTTKLAAPHQYSAHTSLGACLDPPLQDKTNTKESITKTLALGRERLNSITKSTIILTIDTKSHNWLRKMDGLLCKKWTFTFKGYDVSFETNTDLEMDSEDNKCVLDVDPEEFLDSRAADHVDRFDWEIMYGISTCMPPRNSLSHPIISYISAGVHMNIGDTVALNDTEHVILLPMWYGIQEYKQTTASMDCCEPSQQEMYRSPATQQDCGERDGTFRLAHGAGSTGMERIGTSDILEEGGIMP